MDRFVLRLHADATKVLEGRDNEILQKAAKHTTAIFLRNDECNQVNIFAKCGSTQAALVMTKMNSSGKKL